MDIPFHFRAAFVLFFSCFITKAMGQDTLDGVKRILKGWIGKTKKNKTTTGVSHTGISYTPHGWLLGYIKFGRGRVAPPFFSFLFTLNWVLNTLGDLDLSRGTVL